LCHFTEAFSHLATSKAEIEGLPAVGLYKLNPVHP
jgi:hypothetical protein